MKWLHGRVAVVVLIAAAFAAGGLLSVHNVHAVPAPSAVTVVNATDSPVPTSIVGTPSVNVGGTVTVQEAQQPFQQFVTAFSNSSEVCDSIDIPAGKRLVLESFSADADGPNGTPAPFVYLKVTASIQNASSFVRPVQVDLKPSISGWAGVANVLLHSGTPPNSDRSFTYDACVFPAAGATFGSFRGFVSGWLQNA